MPSPMNTLPNCKNLVARTGGYPDVRNRRPGPTSWIVTKEVGGRRPRRPQPRAGLLTEGFGQKVQNTEGERMIEFNLWKVFYILTGFMYLFFFFLGKAGVIGSVSDVPQVLWLWENSLKAQPESFAYIPWSPHLHYRRFAWKPPRPNPPQGRERIPPEEPRDLPPPPVRMCTPVLAETIAGI